MKNGKEIDMFVIFGLIAVATIVSLFFRTNLLLTGFLFFGLPSVYLFVRMNQNKMKVFLFAVLLSFPLSWGIDTFAERDKSWDIPHSLFPFRFFGLATVEVYIFGLLWVLLTICFYEYFFDTRSRQNGFSSHIRSLVYIGLCIVLGVTGVYVINGSLPIIPYFYAISGSVFVFIPLIVFLYYHPQFFPRMVLLSIYFFILFFALELCALHNGNWVFPGTQFLGWITIFGFSFPVEELIFWMLCASPAMVACYEFFADDRK